MFYVKNHIYKDIIVLFFNLSLLILCHIFAKYRIVKKRSSHYTVDSVKYLIYGYQISTIGLLFVLDKIMFYLCDTGMIILVPNMLLQTWFLLLFCEAVVNIKL